jgi:propionyl-CoA carboxylase beta chain
VDEVILPRETRKKVAALLDAFQDKKRTRLDKRHNNIPL